jgi:hypothetical protein
VVGTHLVMRILHYYSSLVIYGMEQEHYSVIFLQVLDQKLQNKLNLGYLEKLVIEVQQLVKVLFNFKSFIFYLLSFIFYQAQTIAKKRNLFCK